jgi:hypothetical protein
VLRDVHLVSVETTSRRINLRPVNQRPKKIAAKKGK